jgi:hypothetical protein
MLYRYGSVASSCERAVSAKTRKDRRLVMTQMLVDLYREKYQLCHLKKLQGKARSGDPRALDGTRHRE